MFAVRTDWDYRDGALYFARWSRERHGCHVVADALRRPDWGREWSDEELGGGLHSIARWACGIQLNEGQFQGDGLGVRTLRDVVAWCG